MGLNETIRLDLDCAGDPPVRDRDQRRHPRRGQPAVGPLHIIRVLGPALPPRARSAHQAEPVRTAQSKPRSCGIGWLGEHDRVAICVGDLDGRNAVGKALDRFVLDAPVGKRLKHGVASLHGRVVRPVPTRSASGSRKSVPVEPIAPTVAVAAVVNRVGVVGEHEPNRPGFSVWSRGACCARAGVEAIFAQRCGCSHRPRITGLGHHRAAGSAVTRRRAEAGLPEQVISICVEKPATTRCSKPVRSFARQAISSRRTPGSMINTPV